MAKTARGQKGKPALPVRRQPVRTCVACRQSDSKRELVRLVRTPLGRVEVDPTGKKAGRGAYLCRRAECWKLGLEKHALERALKTSIGPEDLQALYAYAATLGAAQKE